MSEQNRLSTLKVGVTRKNRIGILTSELDKSALKVCEQNTDLIRLIAKIETQVQSYLIVPASSGVQFGTRRANTRSQSGLNIHVNVFESDFKFEPALSDFVLDGFQSCFNELAFFLGQQAGLCECCCMRDRALNIDPVQTPIVRN